MSPLFKFPGAKAGTQIDQKCGEKAEQILKQQILRAMTILLQIMLPYCVSVHLKRS